MGESNKRRRSPRTTPRKGIQISELEKNTTKSPLSVPFKEAGIFFIFLFIETNLTDHMSILPNPSKCLVDSQRDHGHRCASFAAPHPTKIDVAIRRCVASEMDQRRAGSSGTMEISGGGRKNSRPKRAWNCAISITVSFLHLHQGKTLKCKQRKANLLNRRSQDAAAAFFARWARHTSARANWKNGFRLDLLCTPLRKSCLACEIGKHVPS